MMKRLVLVFGFAGLAACSPTDSETETNNVTPAVEQTQEAATPAMEDAATRAREAILAADEDTDVELNEEDALLDGLFEPEDDNVRMSGRVLMEDDETVALPERVDGLELKVEVKSR